jgi:hypothetical protein
MHIHGPSMMNYGTSALSSIAAAEKAAEAQRAAEARKKLLSTSHKIEEEGDSPENRLLGRWLHSGNNHAQEDEYHPSSEADHEVEPW